MVARRIGRGSDRSLKRGWAGHHAALRSQVTIDSGAELFFGERPFVSAPRVEPPGERVLELLASDGTIFVFVHRPHERGGEHIREIESAARAAGSAASKTAGVLLAL